MDRKQNLPQIGEIQKQLMTPWYTAQIETSQHGSIAATVFDWHGEKFTKLVLHSPIGSQAMILDGEALTDLATIINQAVNTAVK